MSLTKRYKVKLDDKRSFYTVGTSEISLLKALEKEGVLQGATVLSIKQVEFDPPKIGATHKTSTAKYYLNGYNHYTVKVNKKYYV